MELIKTANLIMFLRLFSLSVCHFIYSVSVYNFPPQHAITVLVHAQGVQPLRGVPQHHGQG